jgi:hypothetical protein
MRMLFVGLLSVALCFGDTLTLKSGVTVTGTFLGGDSRTLRMAVGDEIKTYSIPDVTSLIFGAAPQAALTAAAPARAATATPAPAPAESPAPAKRQEVFRPTAQAVTVGPPAQASTEIPAGSNLVIRMIDDVDSMRDTVGQTFRASLDEPAMVTAGRFCRAARM